MPEALILGSDPQSVALKKVVGAATDWSVRAPSTRPKWLSPTDNDTKHSSIKYRRDVAAYDFVIVLSSLIPQAPEAMSFVHRLRTDLYWDGCFVAVMRSVEQAERLRKASFVGEPIDDTRFDQIPGHVVLISPLRISELFSTTNDFDSRVVSPDYWHFDLLRSGRAARLNRQIKKAERGLNDHPTDVDIGHVCREILASVDAIDWSLVAPSGKGHALSNTARCLLEEQEGKEHLTIENCSVILKRAKDLLAQSTFPFPSED
jgi:hypothetical protein